MTMRPGFIWLGVAICAGAWLGCNAILGNELPVPKEESGSGGGAPGSVSSSSGAGGAGGTSAGAGGAGGAGGVIPYYCHNDRGPVLVEVQASANGARYCIDSTEVTREQYGEFLAESPDLSDQPPCNLNVSFQPTVGWPPKSTQKSLPVVGVDFCDAQAFCAWAGKRLCGRIGEAGLDFNGGADPAKSQWLNACSKGGKLAFPYGDSYIPFKCNGVDYGANVPLKVYAAVECEGGVQGLFDMSGNAREWEDSCDADSCRVRGGSYDSHGDPMGELPCASDVMLNRYAADVFTGFRCCRD